MASMANKMARPSLAPAPAATRPTMPSPRAPVMAPRGRPAAPTMASPVMRPRLGPLAPMPTGAAPQAMPGLGGAAGIVGGRPAGGVAGPTTTLNPNAMGVL